MVRLLALLALTASLAIPAAASARSHADADAAAVLCSLHAHLSPLSENPPTASMAFGAAQITIGTDNSVAFSIVVVNPAEENFILGHIHGPASAAMNANVVVPFPIPATHAPFILFTGVVPNVDGHLTRAICATPSNYYVNLHTSVLTGGAIRGQLG
jgi:hypothetical protein